MNDEWHEKNEALRTIDAKRLNGAFAAFNTNVQMEWPARRLLIGIVLGLSPEAVDLAVEELKRVGLIVEHWLQ
jgi:hypothetical protein